HRRGRAPVRPRLQLLDLVPADGRPRDDERRLLHPVLDRAHVRAPRARARVQAPRPVREAGVRAYASLRLRLGSDKLRVELAVGLAVLAFLALFPAFSSGYWLSFILTQTFLMGIAAASLVFLSAYGGMVSLAQAALYGIAAFALGNMVTKGEVKGLHLGLQP